MGSGQLPAAIVARFRSLAVERIKRIESGWVALTGGAAGEERVREIRHDLHTLKGDARVLGFSEIADLCHKLEDLFEAAHARRYAAPDELDLVVTMATRFLALLVRKKAGAPLSGLDLPGFIRQIDHTLADLGRPSSRPPSSGPWLEELAIEAPDRVSSATQRRLAEAATSVFLEALVADEASRDRLRAVWSELGAVVEALSAVSLRSVLARHEPATHELARALGKQVEVIFEPGDVTVHAEAAEALDIATLHSLRNAVDHGIEPSEDRVANGKPAVGTIRIRATMDGDAVKVMIEDDGHGVDWEMVRARGVAMGLLPPERARDAAEDELTEILFQSGFSTRLHPSAISGRGIGLDAVRTALWRAGGGGSVSLMSRPACGTTVILRMPHPSRAVVVQCVELAGADILLAVPATLHLTLEAEGDEPALDPLEVLGLPRLPAAVGASERWIARSSFGAAIRVCAGSALRRVTAERFCPTSEDRPVEIIRVDGREALLLRIDRLQPLAG